YTGIIATNSEFEIERYPRVGDEITSETVFDSISDEKKTAMGNGFFVTWVTTYRDQNGDVVGRQWFRTLRFKTGGAPAGSADN
ncbi:MAG TPA: MaoC family dehydratase N-terminal domain-containing protein, partial [Mycobacterium sp.]|nr:MaoC family dehydratase N-terminal domain-containing protein [Mycobacterium sp.]